MSDLLGSLVSLVKRVNVPISASTTPAEIAEMNRDPWSQSGKYALGWVYFAVVILFLATVIRWYHIWGDKIRIALYKEDRFNPLHNAFPQDEYELPSAATDSSTAQFFPQRNPSAPAQKRQSAVSTVAPLNNTIAFLRWIFYRPTPVWRIGPFEMVLPSLGATTVIVAALAFVTVYCFLPQPLFYSSIKLGSPPLAIRAGMMAVAMVPWIVALSTKANVITLFTGIGHERLNVIHRWAGYICLFLGLVHTVPFYVTPIWKDNALVNYPQYFQQNIYVYGTGLAALVPLSILCLHSLPMLRKWAYEFFVWLHLPIAIVFVAMLFWHTKNYLASWDYLWATVAIWLASSCVRVCFLNWSNPIRMSFLIGEESAVTLLPENAVKVTVPTQMRWRPGQYVYLRMPGISALGNHPFTIASLCSDDFPSDYGEKYRDLTLVFRPFGGFTRKVFERALEHGPYRTYTAFLEGPYGGMQREMAAFDDVIFFAGGSGITAIASQLLNLIKKMRDGKAVTKTVRIVWSLKTPDTMEWFKEELRICRDYAPPNTVHCHFFLTGPRPEYQQTVLGGGVVQDTYAQPGRDIIQEKINDMLDGLGKRNSAFIRQEAAGDDEREKELRRENEDAITALPHAYMVPHAPSSRHVSYNHAPYADMYTGVTYTGASQQPSYTRSAVNPTNVPFNFGFQQPTQPAPPPPQPMPQQQQHYYYPPPSTLARTTPRFAYLPSGKRDGWRTEYTRPDIPRMLNEFSKTFGRRTCVFVCGPPAMRVEVANTVARLQQQVMSDSAKDEIFLHAENYSI